MSYDPEDQLTSRAATAVQERWVAHNPFFTTMRCRMCQALGLDVPATHEASAFVSWLDPKVLSTYLCCLHFGAAFGQEARDLCEAEPAA